MEDPGGENKTDGGSNGRLVINLSLKPLVLLQLNHFVVFRMFYGVMVACNYLTNKSNGCKCSKLHPPPLLLFLSAIISTKWDIHHPLGKLYTAQSRPWDIKLFLQPMLQLQSGLVVIHHACTVICAGPAARS